MNILIINSGSSSLKYQLFAMPGEKPLCSGIMDRIGKEESIIRHYVQVDHSDRYTEKNVYIPDHGEGMKHILDLLLDEKEGVIRSIREIDAVGHSVVHGGEHFTSAVLIDDDVKAEIRSLFSLAPLHNPVNYKCIEFAEQAFPEAKQVAVFDTAFHQTMPDYAFRYAIPA